MHPHLELLTPRRASPALSELREAFFRVVRLCLWLLALACVGCPDRVHAQGAGPAPVITAQPAELPHRTGEGIVRVSATGVEAGSAAPSGTVQESTCRRMNP